MVQITLWSEYQLPVYLGQGLCLILWEASRKDQDKLLPLMIVKICFLKKSILSDPLLCQNFWLHTYKKDFSYILMRWYHETSDPNVSIAFLNIIFQLEFIFNVILLLVSGISITFFIHLKEAEIAFLVGILKAEQSINLCCALNTFDN